MNTYYHEREGGIEISWHHDTPEIPRSITEQSSSYIYEEFVPFGDSNIIIVYTIGSNYYYAGIGILSMESIGGRRIRLNESEVTMASKYQRDSAKGSAASISSVTEIVVSLTMFTVGALQKKVVNIATKLAKY